jgi:hypothetical protein
MNAWTDCLTYEDDGMTAHPVQPDEVLTLQLLECRELRARCPEIYQALIDPAALVNWRRIELGDPPILALSYR